MLHNQSFNDAIRHFNTMLGCPQCEAEQRLQSGALNHASEESRGWYMACWDVAQRPHECGKPGRKPEVV